MRVRILLFGQLKDIVGRPEETLEVQPGTSVSDLMARYAAQFPRFKPIVASIACSVNREYAPASIILREGDEIGLLPPVSGGLAATRPNENQDVTAESPSHGENHHLSQNLKLCSDHCALVRERIDSQRIADSLKAPQDGATAIFEGIVRNNTRGRATLYLDYEAYESMAVNEMERLAQASLTSFKVRDVRLVHRLGRLEIGETSVLVVVASAHRDAAFEACRWLIDTLKKTVPIWKKEYFRDGAMWAQGEPFPDAICAKTEPQPRSAPKEECELP
jgi:molybdopterin synthase catalytic subunit